MSMSSMHFELERIRREEGEDAYQKSMHGVMGGSIGLGSGAIAGAALGSVVPVVGTVIGAVVGGLAGLLVGVQDETATDNLNTALTAVSRWAGLLKG
jgi:phage tail tape-measure protein